MKNFKRKILHFFDWVKKTVADSCVADFAFLTFVLLAALFACFCGFMPDQAYRYLLCDYEGLLWYF